MFKRQEEWEVQVFLREIDYSKSTLNGMMRAAMQAMQVVTYFEGEIIDGSKPS